jgi:retron-type reverse transcriptase
MYKVYTRILDKRLRSIIESELEEKQAAFRPGRQTQDHIFTLRSVMGKIEKNKKIYLAFLDIKAAFDSVPQKYLWEALEKKEVPDQLIKAIQHVYYEVKGVVRLNGHLSKEFNTGKGIKQGASLSPLHFINFMDEITKQCKRRTLRTRTGYWNTRHIYLQALLYADDIVLVADNDKNLQRAVIEWGEELVRKGMRINTKKSKVMCVTKEEMEQNMLIKRRNEKLDQVEVYEFLGTLITSDGRY